MDKELALVLGFLIGLKLLRIGFPVDVDRDHSFVVVVRFIRGHHHFVVAGGTSELRESSGAAFVYRRLSEENREQFCYRFEIVPAPDNVDDITPKNMCDVGYSDSAACALAVAQAATGEGEGELLLLVSCAFAPHPREQGLQGLILDRVATVDNGRGSLLNKWHAAYRHRALALVLHQRDAQLLAAEIGREPLPLAQKIFASPRVDGTPHLVACRPEQFPALLKALGLKNNLFYRQSAGRSRRLSVFLLLLLLPYFPLAYLLLRKPETVSPVYQHDSLEQIVQITGKWLTSAKPPDTASYPQNWTRELWESCVNEQGIVDFTCSAWSELQHEQQIYYVQDYQRWYARRLGFTIRRAYAIGNTQIHMILVPPGKFAMGARPDPVFGSRHAAALPIHDVTIARGFWMSENEITREHWNAVLASAYDEKFKNNPQNYVNWDDCQVFCRKTGLRLPSEAEWEYACRAGTTSFLYWGDTFDRNQCNNASFWAKTDLFRGSEVTRFFPTDESLRATGSVRTPAGTFPANPFGIYDMLGNVLEWCNDNWHKNYEGAPDDGSSWFGIGNHRPIRGGAKDECLLNCVPSRRMHLHHSRAESNVGLRVVKDIE